MTGFRRAFPATAAEVGAARQFLAGLLANHPAAEDAIVCLSELAANAIQHSRSGLPGGGFTVALRRSGAAIRVEVTDAGGPWRAASAGDENGRGLAIVRALSDRQGTTSHYSGQRTVWFELDPR